MKIPSKVVVAGVEIDIEIYNEPGFSCDNSQSPLDGDFSGGFYRIRIFKKALMLDETVPRTIEQRDVERTFFHEMWHCYNHILCEDTKLNSELYATTFSNVCNIKYVDKDVYAKSMRMALIEIRDLGLLAISDIQAKRLLWIIDNTVFRWE